MFLHVKICLSVPLFLIILCLLQNSLSVSGQTYFFNEVVGNVTWCTTSLEEQQKCQGLSFAVERDRSQFGSDYKKVICRMATNKDDCMVMIDEEKADITLLDAGEVFVGGREHSLVPIMKEVYLDNERSYYSVAVVKKGTLPHVYRLNDLRGARGCFPGVGTLAGWVIPIYTLMKYGGMEVVDCNNHVKSTINFFGSSCAVNSLNDKYNPIGDNSEKLCELCIGRVPGEKCTTGDPYYGFEGAFRCLVEAGDIAFLRHTTVRSMLKNRQEFGGLTDDKFELLCRDGLRVPVSNYRACNWGEVPSHALVTSSAKTNEQRRKIQRFLKVVIQYYGKPFSNDNVNNVNAGPAGQRFKRQNYDPYADRFTPNKQVDFNPSPTYEQFRLFDSSLYGLKYNLLLQDSTVDLESLEDNSQTYTSYLENSMAMILGVRDCPVEKMSLCVTSKPEYDKCIKMKSALKAKLLKPEMNCHLVHSHINCMQAIANGDDDVAVLDAGDVYTAGLNYELIPFISEVYNLGKPEYYVVAVAKEQDADTELTYLKGKFTCHPGVNTGAGWIVPLALMISNGWIRSYGCDSMRAAAEYFTKSCVPGALSSEYNSGVPYDNMCDLCHGASYSYCRRDASEDYYGYTGALKCLVEGGGQVAFLKHTTVGENTDGKRKAWWSRNQLRGDFELLCPDGRRGQMNDYEHCSLGVVKANAIVTRGGYRYNRTQLNAYINLFLYAQQFYGRKDQDDFSFAMFFSAEPYSDLIFQDATQQLTVIPEWQQRYDLYLGPDFMRAKRIVDCHAGVGSVTGSLFTLLISLVASFAIIC